jgi:hypothetical protein
MDAGKHQVTLVAADPDGDSLTCLTAAGPAHGAVKPPQGVAPSLAGGKAIRPLLTPLT